MSDDDQSEEKSLPPSDRKLEKAREKGDFAKSQDIVAASVFIAMCLLFGFGAGYFLERFGLLFEEAASAAARGGFSGDEALNRVLGHMIAILTPVFAVSTFAIFLGAIIANRGVVVAVQPILPDIGRINPVKGFQQLFSLKNFIEFLKSLLKTAVFFAVCVFILWLIGPLLVRLPLCAEGCVPLMIWRILTPVIAAAIILFLISAILDAPLQNWLFRRDKRMTYTEQKRERKEQYGDPIVRGQMKRLRRELAARGAAGGGGAVGGEARGSGVRFVVADGGYMAATLHYDPRVEGVPVLIAKASGMRAAAMLDAASIKRWPILNEPALAEALVAEGRAGEPAPKALFNSLARAMIRAGLLGR